MRILIAEDDPKLLKSLVHIFEMNHYAVDSVVILGELSPSVITSALIDAGILTVAV